MVRLTVVAVANGCLVAVVGAEINVESDVLPRYQQRFGRRPGPELAWSGMQRSPEAVEIAISTVAAGGKVSSGIRSARLRATSSWRPIG